MFRCRQQWMVIRTITEIRTGMVDVRIGIDRVGGQQTMGPSHLSQFLTS